MINVSEDAVNLVRKAARDQSERIVRELNADFDARNIALANYNDVLRQVRTMREQADDLERRAHDALNSALTASGSVALSLVNQINQGQIVESEETPAPRKISPPKAPKVDGPKGPEYADQ
jgi:hypothetical protein